MWMSSMMDVEIAMLPEINLQDDVMIVMVVGWCS